MIRATLGTSVLVLLALAVSSLPVAEEIKWYELGGAEMQALAKSLRGLRTLENFDEDGLVSITFGKSSANYVSTDDGTYLFDAYRMVGPKDITHVLLSPASGDPQAPPPPFQRPPGHAISSKDQVESPTSERGEAPIIFPSNAKFYKGSPIYVLEALGKVGLRVTDVKKFMAHRSLA